MIHQSDPAVFDRIIVWLDAYQESLDQLRRYDEATRLRDIIHQLGLFRIETFGVPSPA